MATIRIQHEAFEADAELAAITAGRTEIGGVGCFIGHVRADNSPEGAAVAALVLEDYPAMTRRALADIAGEAERRWALLGCTVIHRVGRLEPGDPIVLVVAAAAHRQAALEAAAFLIDWLKTRAPFWKKEILADGRERWVEPRDSDDTAAARWTREK